MCARVKTWAYAHGLALGVDSGALSLRGARTMRAAVEATMLGGKGLTAPLARRENDTGRLKLLFRGAAGGLFGNRRSWPGCGWFGRAAAVRSGYFAPRRIVGTRKATFRRVCVARSALI